MPSATTLLHRLHSSPSILPEYSVATAPTWGGAPSNVDLVMSACLSVFHPKPVSGHLLRVLYTFSWSFILLCGNTIFVFMAVSENPRTRQSTIANQLR